MTESGSRPVTTCTPRATIAVASSAVVSSIESAEQMFAAHEHADLGAERMQYARELDRDIAAADDRDAARARAQRKEAIRIDAEIAARDRQAARPRSGRDDDVLGRELARSR